MLPPMAFWGARHVGREDVLLSCASASGRDAQRGENDAKVCILWIDTCLYFFLVVEDGTAGSHGRLNLLNWVARKEGQP